MKKSTLIAVLVFLGLLEWHDPDAQDPPEDTEDAVRVSPLWDRFLRFEYDEAALREARRYRGE